MHVLTQKRQKFIERYRETGNIAQSAKEAGYKAKSEKEYEKTGLRILEALAGHLDDESQDIAQKQEILKYLTQMMRREHVDKVVATLSEETSTYVPDEKGTMRKQTVKKRIPTTVDIPVKLSEAMRAAELLGKKYKMWTDRGDSSAEKEVIEVMIVDDEDEG